MSAAAFARLAVSSLCCSRFGDTAIVKTTIIERSNRPAASERLPLHDVNNREPTVTGVFLFVHSIAQERQPCQGLTLLFSRISIGVTRRPLVNKA